MPAWLKWLLSTGALCAAIAAWFLSVDFGHRRDREDPYAAARDSMRREYRIVQGQVSRTLWRDWIRQRVPAGAAVVLQLDTSVSATTVARLAGALHGEYAPAVAPRVAVGLLTLPAELHDYTGLLSSGAEYHASTDPARPYCVGVAARAAWSRDRERSVFEDFWGQGSVASHPLGPCRLWARYGVPGAGMIAWLARGGSRFAMSGRPLERLPASDRGTVFGSLPVGTGRLLLEPCRTGQRARCRAALLEPPLAPVLRGTAQTTIAMRNEVTPWDHAALQLLATLERDYGRDRFERFWRADADVASAFESAFGERIEDWAVPAVQRALGAKPPGARMSASTALLSFVTLGLLAAAALRLAGRRTVA